MGHYHLVWIREEQSYDFWLSMEGKGECICRLSVSTSSITLGRQLGGAFRCLPSTCLEMNYFSLLSKVVYIHLELAQGQSESEDRCTWYIHTHMWTPSEFRQQKSGGCPTPAQPTLPSSILPGTCCPGVRLLQPEDTADDAGCRDRKGSKLERQQLALFHLEADLFPLQNF